MLTSVLQFRVLHVSRKDDVRYVEEFGRARLFFTEGVLRRSTPPRRDLDRARIETGESAKQDAGACALIDRVRSHQIVEIRITPGGERVVVHFLSRRTHPNFRRLGPPSPANCTRRSACRRAHDEARLTAGL